jgi:hypothetical protein
MDKTMTLINKLIASSDQLEEDTQDFRTGMVRHTRQEYEAYEMLVSATAYLRSAASRLLEDLGLDATKCDHRMPDGITCDRPAPYCFGGEEYYCHRHKDRLDPDRIGECDCGTQYDITSREDHNADTGDCWECHERQFGKMTADEYDKYLSDGAAQ